ncbi:MAG: selenium-binding protein SBP56-related protein, partial [Candidatus Zixiibacteriota bacterium]
MRRTYRLNIPVLVILLGLTLLSGCSKKNETAQQSPTEAEKYLFVWAGDQARTSSDFLAVVNFDMTSADYGKVITTVPLPNPGNTGNEPHHVGLSTDGKILACGGLLSVLKGQKEVFFFDVSEPANPKFMSAGDPPLSGVTDEFHALDNGGFLVTMMGGAQGHHPGRVAEFDQNQNLVAEYPANPPDDGFNPHGISVRAQENLMVTSDFICPSTTLHAVEGDMSLRGGVRVWDFQKREITKSIQIGSGDVGTIDVRLIPNDPQLRGFTAGMMDDKLYLFDAQAGTAKTVF